MTNGVFTAKIGSYVLIVLNSITLSKDIYGSSKLATSVTKPKRKGIFLGTKASFFFHQRKLVYKKKMCIEILN